MKKLLAMIICCGVTLCGAGFVIAHLITTAKLESQGLTRAITTETPAETTVAPTPAPLRIHPGSKIVYEYYYQSGNRIESSTETPPYFLMNLTREDIERYFFDWEIIEFTVNQLVLRKNIPGGYDEYYLLGIKDDYVAVFFQTKAGESVLQEVTKMPVGSLSYDERQRLREGVKIGGKSELAAALEDYDS
ncbi:MAG: BofC C-terminal domain-containing protein [Clostridiales bacterium]|jgi:hypothetical protein|nr:BofC C-terminal domain-containing protein [Clostridiales bacterium]